ncbi:MAG: cytochrome P450, partial [Actinocrinis sp.]
LLDAMAALGSDGGAIDFMDQFAFRIPVTVICELLGVPEADRYRFRGLAHDLGIALEMVNDPAMLIPADAATDELRDYFTALVAARRAEPRDDLTSALVHQADEQDGTLSEEELLSNLVLLLFAGFETTTNLFGNGLAVLFDRPRVAEGLRAGTVPVHDFVEEVLRYDSPVQLTSRLVMAEGLEVGGLPVVRGSEVLLLLGAANRDPARFAEPHRFDPARPDNQPLSFGAGGHFCLGAALARLEAATAFPLLLKRFPKLAPAGGAEPVRADRLVLRGYRTLPVTVG